MSTRTPTRTRTQSGVSILGLVLLGMGLLAIALAVLLPAQAFGAALDIQAIATGHLELGSGWVAVALAYPATGALVLGATLQLVH